MRISIPVSAGELLDRIAILRIKSDRMDDPPKLANVREELAQLEAVTTVVAIKKIIRPISAATENALMVDRSILRCCLLAKRFKYSLTPRE